MFTLLTGARTTHHISTPMTGSTLLQQRFASKKQGGKSKNGRDSNPKYRGFKRNHGQPVLAGNIILRQKGTRWHAGEGAMVGRDFTVFATKPGYLKFERADVKKRNWRRLWEKRTITVVDVPPVVAPEQDIR